MEKKSSDFLGSLLAPDQDCVHTTQDIIKWLKDRREAVAVSIERIPFKDLRRWHFQENSGNLVHESGKFFSIEGVDIQTSFGIKRHWQQPIINQPEIGILGIVTKRINGVLHFLMQAKIEPGNINFVQLSPTLQATKSNYTQVHGGNRPTYLEYFNGQKSVKVVVDQLQSEQGARFLKKRNRNMIVEVDEEISPQADFIWASLGQIKALMKWDNLVNMDTRTVLSSIGFGRVALDMASSLDQRMYLSAIHLDRAIYSMEEHIAWITRLKLIYDLEVRSVSLNKVQGWLRTENEIRHEDGKYFSVVAVRAKIGNREVMEWTQPIIQSAQEGIIGFIVREINGVYHFLVQAKVESGNFDILELAPTVQCLTGNYRRGQNEYDVPFIEYFLQGIGVTLHSSFQSEEGGRFLEEQNLNTCLLVDDSFPVDGHPENYRWMSLGQLMEFLKYNNYLNIQARSLVSLLDLKKI